MIHLGHLGYSVHSSHKISASSPTTARVQLGTGHRSDRLPTPTVWWYQSRGQTVNIVSPKPQMCPFTFPEPRILHVCTFQYPSLTTQFHWKHAEPQDAESGFLVISSTCAYCLYWVIKSKQDSSTCSYGYILWACDNISFGWRIKVSPQETDYFIVWLSKREKFPHRFFYIFYGDDIIMCPNHIAWAKTIVLFESCWLYIPAIASNALSFSYKFCLRWIIKTVQICDFAWENQAYWSLLRKWGFNKTDKYENSRIFFSENRTVLFQTDVILLSFDKFELSKK